MQTPFGEILWRPLDHQSTMGAYVGQLAKKGGQGVMVNWHYADGAKVQPSDQEVARCARSERLRCPVAVLNGLAGASSLFLVAAGLSLIFGVSRIVNFAHGSLYMLGMYLAVSLSGTLGFWLSVPLAAALVAAAGFIIETTLLRRIYKRRSCCSCSLRLRWS